MTNTGFRQEPVFCDGSFGEIRGEGAVLREAGIRGYYLNIRELLEDEDREALWSEALGKVDAVRREKAGQCRPGRAKAASLGAGLLLQLAVQEAEEQCRTGIPEKQTESEVKQSVGEECGNWQFFSVREILLRLHEPWPLTYRYGDRGKPYFENYPWYFSISHSGDYVLCVLSEEETGADLQRLEAVDCVRLSKRFFAAAEYEAVRKCEEEAAARTLFFDLWTKKEAWGKLTGLGVASVLGEDVRQSTLPLEDILPPGKVRLRDVLPPKEGCQQNLPPSAEYPPFMRTDQPEWLKLPVPEGYSGALCRRNRTKS